MFNRYLFFTLLVLPLLVHPESKLHNCLNLLKSSQAILKSEPPKYSSVDGDFGNVSLETANKIKHRFKEFQTQKQVSYNVDTIAPLKIDNISTSLSRTDSLNANKRRQIFNQNAHKLHYITSAAGQWSRGKIKTIKALVPYNLKEILGPSLSKRVLWLDKIIDHSDEVEIRRLAKLLHLKETQNVSIIRKEASEALSSIIQKASNQFERALNPLDLKFVNIALLSKQSNQYIPFDIITAPHTHTEIVNYVEKLKNGFKNKIFHLDPAKNQKIQSALEDYFKTSDHLSDSHVIGYQREVHALDPSTGEFVSDSTPSSIGAGNFLNDLEASGKMRVFDKEIYHFDNIEVVSNLDDVLPAHIEGGKPVSITVVPAKEGYKGGSPYIVKKSDGTQAVELVEDYLVPDQIKKQGELFNTGSITINQTARRPSALNFESKTDKTTGKKIMRVKSTPGDFTQENSTNVILGRLEDNSSQKRDYENFKSWNDYLNNGDFYLKTIQNNF